MFQFPSVDKRCFCCGPTSSYRPPVSFSCHLWPTANPTKKPLHPSECAVNTVGPLPQLAPTRHGLPPSMPFSTRKSAGRGTPQSLPQASSCQVLQAAFTSVSAHFSPFEQPRRNHHCHYHGLFRSSLHQTASPRRTDV